MKVEELMVGDLVRFGNSQGSVRDIVTVGSMYPLTLSINETESDFVSRTELHLLKPIPITGAFLEKNGFVHTSYGWRLDCDGYVDYRIRAIQLTGGRIRLEIAENKTNNFFVSFVAEHIHELQHALRLCRINLDVNVLKLQ
ncbi:MAG: hypothetical protein K5890_05700 [Bacteroidales bacterium]|nr:hypothetical protein [Bacteroidales bacterium]